MQRFGRRKGGAQGSVKTCLHEHLPGKYRGTLNALEWKELKQFQEVIRSCFGEFPQFP